TFKATFNTINMELVPGGGPDHGAYGGIHARSVSSGSEYGDSADVLSFHTLFLGGGGWGGAKISILDGYAF
ncbi:MAG: hypothetical protein ACI974_001859, partial [Paraglaciecola sp.]